MRVAYLIATAVAVFALPAWPVVALAIVHVGLWLVAGMRGLRLLRALRKLIPLGIVVALTFALTSGVEPVERWVDVPGLPLDLNVTGLLAAGLMMLRIAVVVLASQVARAGDPAAFVGGLRRLGAPERIALALDTTLVLLGPGGGGGRGMGGGGGRGGGRGRGGAEPASPYRALAAVVRGDVEPLVSGIRGSLSRAEAHVLKQAPGRDRDFVHDVAVIAGLSLAMLSLKLLKVLPGIPFAPGHKGVLFIPLYVLAGALTRARWGATLCGVTMGTVAFLMGDGRYGVFEILKHVAPGVVVDLLLPLVRRPGREPGAIVWAVFGVIVASGRFATVVVLTLLVQAPLATWALLAPVGAVHLVFGALSGFVTRHLLRAGRLVPRAEPEPAAKPAMEPSHGPNR